MGLLQHHSSCPSRVSNERAFVRREYVTNVRVSSGQQGYTDKAALPEGDREAFGGEIYAIFEYAREGFASPTSSLGLFHLSRHKAIPGAHTILYARVKLDRASTRESVRRRVLGHYRVRTRMLCFADLLTRSIPFFETQRSTRRPSHSGCPGGAGQSKHTRCGLYLHQEKRPRGFQD